MHNFKTHTKHRNLLTGKQSVTREPERISKSMCELFPYDIVYQSLHVIMELGENTGDVKTNNLLKIHYIDEVPCASKKQVTDTAVD